MNDSLTHPAPDPTPGVIFVAWAAMDLAYRRAALERKRHGRSSAEAAAAWRRARRLNDLVDGLLGLLPDVL